MQRCAVSPSDSGARLLSGPGHGVSRFEGGLTGHGGGAHGGGTQAGQPSFHSWHQQLHFPIASTARWPWMLWSDMTNMPPLAHSVGVTDPPSPKPRHLPASPRVMGQVLLTEGLSSSGALWARGSSAVPPASSVQGAPSVPPAWGLLGFPPSVEGTLAP